MSHFAHVKNGVVDQVIVIEEDVLNNNGGWYCPECGVFIDKSEWVQTSFNTKNGKHERGGTPLRKNFASKGFTYDPVRDAFIPPKPHQDFILDEVKGNWKAPKEKPKDGKEYVWDDSLHDFVVFNIEK
jgi:hypothetical protein